MRACAVVEVSVRILGNRLWVVSVFSASLSLLGFGCATGGSEVRHGIGAGQWEARLPTTRSPIQSMAYGRGGSSEPAADLGLDDALAALDRSALERSAAATQPLAAPRVQNRVAARKAPREQPAAATLTAPVEKAAEPAPTSAELASRVQVDEPLALAQNTADNRYAEREAQAKEQQKFAGGDAIVITSGAILLVLLIVLLVLLLR
jgi:hypothetical protein